MQNLISKYLVSINHYIIICNFNNFIKIHLIEPEERERILQMSLSAVKQFCEPRHTAEITNYIKEINLIESKVKINFIFMKENFFSFNLIPKKVSLSKARLVQDIDVGLAMTKVFKDIMLSFYPDKIEWASRNAEKFMKLCPNTITATIHFLNESNPNSIAKFNHKIARKALR